MQIVDISYNMPNIFRKVREALYPVVKDTQPLAIALPAAGNRIASRGQSHCQPRAIALPAAGNRSAGRGQSKCQPRAIEVPAAGTSSASRGQSKCQPRVHRVPAAGTSSTSRGHIEYQPWGIVFPWESCLFLISLDTFLLHYLKQ